jgi:hypothetical protein
VKQRTYKNIYRNTAIGVFVLMVVFLFFSPVSIDERMTLEGVQKATFADLINYRVFTLANNHLFVSLWARLLHVSSILSIPLFRLPSLLSFIVFAVYLYKLLRLHGPKITDSFYAPVLLVLPYIPYFSAGRGYGMALAFTTAALYYYRLCVTNNKLSYHRSKTKPILLFTLMGMIGALSIFSFYYALAAMMLWLFVKYAILQRTKLIVTEKAAIIISIITIAALSLYIYKCGKIISASDPSIIGTNILFRGGSLSSIITYLSLENNFSGTFLLAVKLIITISMAAAIIYMVFKRAFTDETGIALTILGLLIISHYVTGSMYPVTRGLMFLIFLLYVNMIYASIRHNSIFIKAHLIIMALIGLAFLGFTVNVIL